MKTVPSMIAVAVLALSSAACSDTSGREAGPADAESRTAESEAELFMATSTSNPTTVTIEGTVSIALDDSVLVRASCAGAGRFGGISDGADVVVLDDSGDTIGTSSLEAGQVMEDVKVILGDDPSRFTLRDFCTFPFAIDGVVDDATFYTFEVANGGSTTFTNAGMVNQEWTVALSLR